MCDLYCKHSERTWSEFLHGGHTIRLYAAEYTWRLKPPNTEPDICDLWSSYFRSTDTLRLQWPFPLQTGRRCFPLAVEYLNPIRIDHVTLWWAADNRCARARESVCPWSCSKHYNLSMLSFWNKFSILNALSFEILALNNHFMIEIYSN